MKELAALAHLFLEVAVHQAEPVAVDDDLVLGVDRGNRISQSMIAVIADSSQTSEIRAGIVLADRRRGIDQDFDMQAVLRQQDMRRLHRHRRDSRQTEPDRRD